MVSYISSNDNSKHISDLFNGIGAIIFVPDVIAYFSAEASTDFPYNLYSDEDLLELNEVEVHTIDPSDTITLTRIYKLAPEKLSAKQLKNVLNILATKVIADETDVENIISDRKQCDKAVQTGRGKNAAFGLKYNLTEEDKLYVVQNLTLADYVTSTKSGNANFGGNDLIIFEPTIDLTLNGKDVSEKITIYIKIDLTISLRKISAVSPFINLKRTRTASLRYTR